MAKLYLDISRYQPPAAMNYAELCKHIDGVILRAGYTGHGTGNSYYKDPTFDVHYANFKAHGVPIGAYWYSCANTTAEGVAEAKYFLQVVAGKQLDLPLWWDTEDAYHQAKVSKKQLTDTGIAFMGTLRNAGYAVGLYASTSWLNNRLEMSRLGGYDVWVAHYGVSKPSYQGHYDIWQFTSTKSLPGYRGGLDANYVYKDYGAKSAGQTTSVVYGDYPPGRYRVTPSVGLRLRKDPSTSATHIKTLPAGSEIHAIEELRANVDGVWLRLEGGGYVCAQMGQSVYVEPLSAPQKARPQTREVGTFQKYESATFTPNTTVNVRAEPTTQSEAVAKYHAGEPIRYDRVYVGAGYVWVSYIGRSGKRRYVACRTYQNGRRGEPWGSFR